MKKDGIQMLQLKQIDRPKVSGRDSMDPSKIIELAESIREKGLLEPIIVTPRNGRYEIVAGDRRYLAHEHLGLDRIPAIIKDVSDIDIIILRAVENLQRENLTPLEEARAYNTMREECGMSVEDICRATGRTFSTVKRYLRFWRMPDDFKAAVDRGGVCLGVAEKLIEVDDPFLRSQWLKMAVENGITVQVAELWVSDYQKSKAGKLHDGIGDLGEGELEVEEKKVYVTCQVCSAPVEIRVAKQLIGCPECIKAARGSKNVKV